MSGADTSFEYKVIAEDGTVVADGCGDAGKETEVELKGILLWSERSPKLYTLRVTYKEDVSEISFGIKTLTWDREHGMRVNGKRILLRGACIHSDNQLLGSVTDPDDEIRRVKLLKKWGYNAIRSAHNPCSRYLLDACDRYGMYMMDEYVDMWYIHKNKYDYAKNVESNEQSKSINWSSSNHDNGKLSSSSDICS